MCEAGNYECDMAVKVGRPISKAEILDMIRGHAKAKAVGIGHRWGGTRASKTKAVAHIVRSVLG